MFVIQCGRISFSLEAEITHEQIIQLLSTAIQFQHCKNVICGIGVHSEVYFEIVSWYYSLCNARLRTSKRNS
jgi:hypothetical protein